MRPIFCVPTAFVLSLILLSQGYTSPLASQQTDATAQYVIDPKWPHKPEHFTWGQTPGVTVDSRDHIYVFTRSDLAVQIYQTDGTLLDAWKVEDSNGAHFIRIGPSGNVWTSNIKTHTIRKYSPEGKLLLTLGQPGQAGADTSHFDRPTDMAILPSGDIFVSDGYGNRRIIHFNATGKFINEWGEA